jgi:hypothetical protein
VRAMVQLDPSTEDMRQAREALLGLLASQTDYWAPQRLVGGIAQLTTSPDDKRQARDALLGLLASQTDRRVAEQLMGGMVQLEVTVRDLSAWPPSIPPTVELLTAARRNSALNAWLAGLPTLPVPSG